MEKIKEILEELAEKYKDQKAELVLMLLFVTAGLCMGAGDISREAASGHAVSEGELLSTEEATMTGEKESGQEETEESAGETDTEEEMSSETESGIREETETETETETEDPEAARRHDRRRMALLGSDFVVPMAMPEDYVRPEFDENGSVIGGEEMLPVYTLKDSCRLPGYELPELEKEEEDQPVMERLEEALQEKLASYDGEWSVYVKNLKNDESLLINDRPMKSASVMKLFILGTMYKAFEDGEMERTDELLSLMKDMIIYSSNEASNELLYRLGDSDYGRGIARVNAFIQEYGFSDMTVEYNGFDNPATNMGTGHYNQVSAKDCGRLLEAIYHREWVSRSVSNEIEQMMLNQNTRYKIPAGLPEGVLCGNKTGEMDSTENDAAVVYGDDCDYILVVLSSDWNSKDEAISRIQSVSSLVYEYLEEQDGDREEE